MRHDTCLTCDAHFTAPYRHPMIEEAHCPECLTIVRECVMEQFANVGACPAMRSNDV